MTRTLSKFVLRQVKGDHDVEPESDMETYFSIPNHHHNSTGNGSFEKDPDLTIPASFCVDSVANKVVTCPRIKLSPSAKVI